MNELVLIGGRSLKIKVPPKGASCPICGTPPRKNSRAEHLVIHHWGKGSKLSAIREGRCRWLCRGCNGYLGRELLEAGIEEATWEEQREVLFSRARDDSENFPYFNEGEKSWSLVINPEDTMVKKAETNKKSKTEEALRKAMKVAQRELPDDKLKVELLSSLVDFLEKVGGKDGTKQSA
jgi:hypothetical protein